MIFQTSLMHLLIRVRKNEGGTPLKSEAFSKEMYDELRILQPRMYRWVLAFLKSNWCNIREADIQWITLINEAQGGTEVKQAEHIPCS